MTVTPIIDADHGVGHATAEHLAGYTATDLPAARDGARPAAAE